MSTNFLNAKEVKNTLFLLSERGITLLFTFTSFLVMAKSFGSSQFGVLSYALSFTSLLFPLSELAYTTIVTRFLTLGHSPIDLLRKSLFLRSIGYVSILAVVLLVSELMNLPKDIKSVIIIVALASLMDIFTIYKAYFDSELKSKYYTYSQSLGTVIGSLARIFISLYNPDILFIGISYVIEKTLTASLIFYFFKKARKKVTMEKYLPTTTSKLFLQSLPLIITNFLILINFKVDQLLIEHFLNSEAVGRYAVVARLSEVWYLIPMALFTSYFPMIVKGEGSGKSYLPLISKIVRCLLICSVLISIIATIFGEVFILKLFGQDYKGVGSILSIHIWASIAFFVGHPISKILIAKKLIWINLHGKIIAAFLNVGLNLILIPRYGLNGAAAASLISYSFGYYFYYLLNPKTRRLSIDILKS